MKSSKAICLSLLFIMIFNGACYSKKQPEHAENKGFALVELFTSEGCSSCPAAEAALAELNDAYKENVYVLEFHVDYWNNLGWKDAFSSSEYTERQQQYAAIFHLNSTYTPQAIINGANELVGSDRAKMHSFVNSYLQKEVTNKIGLDAITNGRNVAVNYSVTDIKGQVLNIAMVQKRAETNVRRGENSGRKLVHTNIVRELKTITPREHGVLDIVLPEGLSAKDCLIIAYTQDKESREVTCAAQASIN